MASQSLNRAMAARWAAAVPIPALVPLPIQETEAEAMLA